MLECNYGNYNLVLPSGFTRTKTPCLVFFFFLGLQLPTLKPVACVVITETFSLYQFKMIVDCSKKKSSYRYERNYTVPIVKHDSSVKSSYTYISYNVR